MEPHKTNSLPVYFKTVQVQGTWFIEIYDAQRAAMGIVSRGGRPAGFLDEWEAITEAFEKRLVTLPRHDGLGDENG